LLLASIIVNSKQVDNPSYFSKECIKDFATKFLVTVKLIDNKAWLITMGLDDA
jgi:hypothetical protein